MFFKGLIFVFFIIILLLVFNYLKSRRISIFLVYPGPYSGKMPLKRIEKNPPTSFYNIKSGGVRIFEAANSLKDLRYSLFEVQDKNREIILVDFEEKYPPEVGEEIIIRKEGGGNYYIRKVEIIYNGYDDVEDYRYQLSNGQVISYPEIIGNVFYKAIS